MIMFNSNLIQTFLDFNISRKLNAGSNGEVE